MTILGIEDHISRIVSATGDSPMARSRVAMSQSWRRCLDTYRFDPAANCKIDVLTEMELHHRQQASDAVIRCAEAEMADVFSAVSDGGFSMSLSDTSGHILKEFSNYDSYFYSEVERCGTLWTEEAAGTNGIGTCLVERKPILVLTHDHFFHSFSELSCAVAPLFDAQAQMTGVVNISIRSPSLHRETLQAVHGLTLYTVNRMDERLFRHAFRRNHILRFSGMAGGTGLIATNAHFQVLGMNHAARRHLLKDAEAEMPKGLWHLFERDYRLMAPGRADGAVVSLRPCGGARALDVTVIDPVDILVRPSVSRAKSAPVETPAGALSLDECAGSDAGMLRSIRNVRRVAEDGLPVLVLGETGVGKDAFARAVHADSPRRNGPFVAFNCAAVPETLIDSELFGYGGGAFTGARKEGYAGRVVEADGGTLFLDEIGDMPLPLQTRLLRILENGEVTPLGSTKARAVDIQVIAATNQHLDERVEAGLFRRDLYYRLAGLVVEIPALRQRADLASIVAQVLERIPGGRAVILSDEARMALIAHQWPGNIRELRHVLQRAVRLCEGGVISIEDLMLPPPGRALPIVTTEMPVVSSAEGTARAAAEAAERDTIAAALDRCAGNVKEAAGQLGLSRATLYRRLKRYDLLP